jgi:tetratricopeptide (TPR) repeat protein
VTIDVNWVIAIATVAAAIGAVVGVIIAQRQGKKGQLTQQKQELERQVSKEVEAKIGSILLNLRELESDASKQMAGLTSQIDEKQKLLTADIQSREKALADIVEKSSSQAQQIENLLQRANLLIPTIANAEVLPMQLFVQAASSQDPSQKTAYLFKILEHPDSDPRILELAGDAARKDAGNRKLAEKLYSRAVSMDSDSVTARAEYLHLMAFHPSERLKAKDEITQLANAHPNSHTVINNLVNFFIQVEDYQALLDVATTLLEKSKEKSLLWRNIAVARAELDYPNDSVVQAYEKAFELADPGDYVNTARPYLRLLINHSSFSRAGEVLAKAIRYMPSEAELHMLQGDLHRVQGQYDQAKECYQLGRRLGDQEDIYLADRRLRDIEILQLLGL